MGRFLLASLSAQNLLLWTAFAGPWVQHLLLWTAFAGPGVQNLRCATLCAVDALPLSGRDWPQKSPGQISPCLALSAESAAMDSICWALGAASAAMDSICWAWGAESAMRHALRGGRVAIKWTRLAQKIPWADFSLPRSKHNLRFWSKYDPAHIYDIHQEDKSFVPLGRFMTSAAE